MTAVAPNPEAAGAACPRCGQWVVVEIHDRPRACGACDDTGRIPMLGGGSMPCVRCRKGQDARLDHLPESKGAHF